MQKRINYVEKEDMLVELKLLHKTGVVSEKLHIMFFTIAKNYATLKSFRTLPNIEDMIVEAYINCVIYAHKFDITKKQPFSYFTTTIHRNFLNYINKEKKQQEKKWIELKKVVDMYRHENDVEVGLPKNILDKVDGYV